MFFSAPQRGSSPLLLGIICLMKHNLNKEELNHSSCLCLSCLPAAQSGARDSAVVFSLCSGFHFSFFCLCVRPPCLFLSHSCCLERESIGTKMGYKRYEGESEEKRKQPIKAGTFGLTKEKSRVDTQSLIRICSPQAAVHTLKELAGSIARGFGYKYTSSP